MGIERRRVRVGFVTSASIWKTSYRLNTAGTQAQLQAWDSVVLTLTSGRPKSFQQNLFDPIHRTRPVVPVEQLGLVMPRVDQGTTAVQQRALEENTGLSRTQSAPRIASSAAPAPAPAPTIAAAALAYIGPRATRKATEPLQDQSTGFIESALAQDQGTQMHYTLGHAVTVPKGHSLSVPSIATPQPSRHLASYQPQVSSQYPLSSLELQNASANALLAAAVTLNQEASSTDASFLGEANLAQVPAGEKRMLSFALDQKLAISAAELTTVDQSKVRSSVEKTQPTIKAKTRSRSSLPCI